MSKVTRKPVSRPGSARTAATSSAIRRHTTAPKSATTRRHTGAISKPTVPKSAPGGPRVSKTKLGAEDLEAEYLRVNAQLEAQAANLLSEADTILKRQEEKLLSPNTSVDFELSEIEDDQAIESQLEEGTSMVYRDLLGKSLDSLTPEPKKNNSPRKSPSSAKQGGKGGPVDEFLATIADVDNETAIRLLNAQLRATQEALTTAHEEVKTLALETKSKGDEIKGLTSENSKLKRTTQVAQDQAEKLRSDLEDKLVKLRTSENQIRSMKKEIDEMRRSQKQIESKNNTLQIRLNRAQEEAENLSKNASRSRQSTSHTNEEVRKELDDLRQHNKQLLSQRKELAEAFKKQLQLIDILKRQKLHVEAARVLQFSEEEFVKALDWGVDT